jgi:CysZ protein
MKKITALKKLAKSYNSKLIEGIEHFVKAHQFVWKNNLRKYLIISGILFLLLFEITIELVLEGVDYVEPDISKFLLEKLKMYVNLGVKEINYGITGAFWLIKHSIESHKDSIFTSIFLVVGTPYFSIISRKISEILLDSNNTQHSWYKEIVRGLRLSMKNTVKQLLLILIITVIAFIPVIGIFTPLLTFIVQAYYNGILMTDYSLERHGYSIKESEVFYKNNKPVLFAIGLGFMFMLLIPVIGWFLAPTYALAASGLYFSNHFKKNNGIC